MSLGYSLNTAFDPAPDAPTLTIAQIAQNDAFDVLRIALKATDLTATFNHGGDFTVFAPTDDAFRELAEHTLGIDTTGLGDGKLATALVDALGVDLLTEVLTYHVAAGSNSLVELQTAGSVETLFGTDLTIAMDSIIDADPEVENAEFIRGLTDVGATNGVIHAVDQVLLPIDVEEATTKPTIADVASGDSRFEVLTAALVATGLVDAVANRDADFTVFAPTDKAFRELADALGIDDTGLDPAGLAGALVDALGAETVTNVLLYHVAGESLSAAELTSDGIVETLLDNGRLVFDAGSILDASPQTDASVFPSLVDIDTANGLIHVVDSVLLPFDLDPTNTSGQGTGADERTFLGGGNDKYSAAGGDDLVVDGAGDDQINGARGNDILSDGAGNDRYSGGADSDVFDLSAMQGRNVIKDYSDEDLLAFSFAEFASEQDVLDAAVSDSRGTKIVGEEGSVLVRDLDMLTTDDFVLV
ncbi:MAG: fasciclin domain-containing protein [Pseudomonadota bacterium]